MRKNHFHCRKSRAVAFLLTCGLLTASLAANRSAASSSLQQRASASGKAGKQTRLRTLAKTSAALLNLPLSFEPANGANEFFVRGGGHSLSLTPLETAISFGDRRLRIKLAGANARAKALALGELPGKRNYLVGNDPAKWRTD